MGYSVRDFLVSLLLQWLFNKGHPVSGARYAVWTFVQLLMNAAQAKDYVETVCDLDPGLPDAYTLFWRLSECASLDLILQEYKKSREEKHRGGEEADKKEAIHYSY
ncbi:MAG: hypothetical protein N2V75_07620 [Methanophagales archaeon]|nr:hypothetical protein [Methanophagales archaeon]